MNMCLTAWQAWVKAQVKVNLLTEAGWSSARDLVLGDTSTKFLFSNMFLEVPSPSKLTDDSPDAEFCLFHVDFGERRRSRSRTVVQTCLSQGP